MHHFPADLPIDGFAWPWPFLAVSLILWVRMCTVIFCSVDSPLPPYYHLGYHKTGQWRICFLEQQKPTFQIMYV